MRTISYTAKERRAANQVWNAAERYNFDPLFLAVETGDLDSVERKIVKSARKKKESV